MVEHSTALLDKAIAEKRESQERLRLRMIRKALKAVDELGKEIAFEEAWLFGSITKPFRFSERSDVDIAFAGLDDKDFFAVMSFLSEKTGHDVDVVQLEGHRLADKIKKGGIRWKRGE